MESSEGARLHPGSGARALREPRKGEATTTPQPASVEAELTPKRRPRRRHRDAQQRPHRIVTRFNTAERDEIVAAAEQREQTLSRFVATSTLASARAHLARVGNNLNQVAFAFNAGGHIRPDDLDATLVAVRAAVATVDRVAARLVTGAASGP